jgi:hypothetical protein
MDVIADKLEKEADSRQTGLDKVKSLAKRIKWLRAAKLAATSVVLLHFGVPPVGAVGEVIDLGKKVWDEGLGKDTVDDAKKAAADAAKVFPGAVIQRLISFLLFPYQSRTDSILYQTLSNQSDVPMSRGAYAARELAIRQRCLHHDMPVLRS